MGVAQEVRAEQFSEFQAAAGAILRQARPLDTAASVVAQLQVDVDLLKHGVEPHQVGVCLVHLVHLAARLNIDLLEEAHIVLNGMPRESAGSSS